MNKIGLLRQLKSEKKPKKLIREDLVSFVSFQFKQLARKHLKIPIQLYQL